jgi:hypothetical protein
VRRRSHWRPVRHRSGVGSRLATWCCALVVLGAGAYLAAGCLRVPPNLPFAGLMLAAGFVLGLRTRVPRVRSPIVWRRWRR